MAVSDEQTPANDNNLREMEKELLKWAMEIANLNSVEDEIFAKAFETLDILKTLKSKKRKAPADAVDVPLEFRCPISTELMKEPVVLASGETYDRPFIENWLNNANMTCPQTKKVIDHRLLIPNKLVCALIARWCNKNGIAPPSLNQNDSDGVTADADRVRLTSLLNNMSSSISDDKEAVKEIRFLTKEKPSLRSFFFESPENLPRLLTPLISNPRDKLDEHPGFEEDLITSILNLSILEENKKTIAEHPRVLPLLVESLRFGTMVTRSNAAAALFTLSVIDSNKELIIKAGALKPLIELLDEGNPPAMMDACQAIFKLCTVAENRERAVNDGALAVIMRKIEDKVFVDELLPILVMLASEPCGINELGKLEVKVMQCLLGIIRENKCERSREHCCVILLAVCLCKRDKLNVVSKDEKIYGTISMLAKNGNARAQRKARSILNMLEKGKKPADTA